MMTCHIEVKSFLFGEKVLPTLLPHLGGDLVIVMMIMMMILVMMVMIMVIMIAAMMVIMMI